jgi:hypothetical protein
MKIVLYAVRGRLGMKTESLKYLIAISKERTMADAAEKLFLTPQALSMAIKKLEQELNMKLLYRFPNGVVLSENGEWLVELASHFFDNIDRRMAEYADYLTDHDIEPKGKAVIAVNSLGVTTIKLTDVVCAINQKFPDFEIEIVEQPREEIEKMVLEDRVDFGFVFRTKYNGKFIDELPNTINFNPLQSGELIIQAAPHLNLSKNDNIFLRKIAKQKTCSYAPDKAGNNVEMLYKMLNCETEHHIVCSYAQYVANVSSGKYLGLSVKLDDSAQYANPVEGTKLLHVQDNVDLYFGLIRKKGKPFSTNMQYLFKEILEAYNLTKNDLTADL